MQTSTLALACMSSVAVASTAWLRNRLTVDAASAIAGEMGTITP
jgi:hypothetical protein